MFHTNNKLIKSPTVEDFFIKKYRFHNNKTVPWKSFSRSSAVRNKKDGLSVSTDLPMLLLFWICWAIPGNPGPVSSENGSTKGQLHGEVGRRKQWEKCLHLHIMHTPHFNSFSDIHLNYFLIFCSMYVYVGIFYSNGWSFFLTTAGAQTHFCTKWNFHIRWKFEYSVRNILHNIQTNWIWQCFLRLLGNFCEALSFLFYMLFSCTVPVTTH